MRRQSMYAPMAAVILTGVLLGIAVPAAAAPAYPRADGRCVDQTGVLGRALCAKVTRILLRDEAQTTDEIAVAVVPTTGDASIERWSTGLFNAWGVGKKDKNNGVLLVVALDDRRLRLETGRGMTKRLPDDTAGEIISTVITPQFKQGRYAAGILAGLDAVRRHIGHRFTGGARLTTLTAQAPDPPDPPEADATPQPADDTGPVRDDKDEISGDVREDGTLVYGEPTMLGSGLADGFPGWMCLPMILFGVVALIGVLRGQGGSGGSSVGSGGSRWHGHRSGSSGGSASSWSSSADSSSSSSSSSFGGGSSDGGGSSGSW